MVRLQLFGSLGLTGDDGRELRPLLAQPKRLAVLVYLVLAEPRGLQRRDILVSLFWPEQPPEAARAGLRRALHFLRSHLGDGVIVSRGEEEVAVAGDRVTCDAVDFETHLAAGRDADALALYHGDLLAGFFVSEAAPDLDEWFERTRRRYRERAADAAGRLADRETAAGQLSTARFWAQRALDLAPLSEHAVLRMLRILERGGERVVALELAEAFGRRLHAELAVEPGPEIRAVVRDLRLRRPTPQGPPSSSPPAARGAGAPARRLRWGALAAGIVLLGAGIAWVVAARRPRTMPVLAVGAVTPQGGGGGSGDSSGVAATLPGLLATGLASLPDVQVITRARLYEVGGELRGQGLGPAALLSAAKRAGADRLVEGEVYAQPDGWRLDLRLVTLESGAVRRSWVVRARDAFALATVRRPGSPRSCAARRPRRASLTSPRRHWSPGATWTTACGPTTDASSPPPTRCSGSPSGRIRTSPWRCTTRRARAPG